MNLPMGNLVAGCAVDIAPSTTVSKTTLHVGTIVSLRELKLKVLII